MNTRDDFLKDDLLQEIKNVKRQRNIFPFLLLMMAFFLQWSAGGDITTKLSEDMVLPFVVIIGVIFIGMETLNVKILLLKAELREIINN